MTGRTSERGRVLCIGGGSGLGRACAQAFADAGFDVLIGGRDSGKLEAACKELGPSIRALAIDVRNRDSVNAFFTEAGRFDHLVITAASKLSDTQLSVTDLTEVKSFAETKLWGALACVQAALPSINDGGSVTLVSGAVSQKGRSGSFAKAITNGALEALGRALAVELGPKVRVNTISPAVFNSSGAMTEARRVELEGIYPAGYVGRASDVAAIVYATAVNRFMTGATVIVDGGWTAK